MSRQRIIAEQHYVCYHCSAGFLADRCPRCGAFESRRVQVVHMEGRPADVQRALERSAQKADRRRFTGEPITGFGELTP